MADNPYAPSPLDGAPAPARPITPTPSYAPSQLGGAAPTASTGYLSVLPSKPAAPAPSAYAPSYSVKNALINAGATPTEATTLTAVSGAESGFGKSPVSPQNKDGSRDYGYFQINNKAHPQMGGAAVASMPLDQQAKLALQIARSREGFGAWTTYKSGAYKSYMGKDATGPGAVPTTPGTTLNTQPPATSIANALAGGTGASGQGLSPIQQLQKDVGGGDQSQALQPAPPPPTGRAGHAQPASRGPSAATGGDVARRRARSP